jgi:class 3 adenylate cyclase
MSAEREVRYADSGGLQIAYEVIGDGPIDVVVAWDHGAHLDVLHEFPAFQRFMDRVAEFGRVIHVDPRGVGLSDPIESVPPLEDWVEDVRVVLRAVGSKRAAFFGGGQAAQWFMLFAAMYPNETSALISLNGYARLRQAPDYPVGAPDDFVSRTSQLYAELWGTGGLLGLINPSTGSVAKGRELMARLERSSATPGRASRRQEIASAIDVRDVLPVISAPTLILQVRGDRYIRSGHARYLAENIPGAKLLEIDGTDHMPAPDTVDAIADAVEEFLTGHKPRAATQRALMSVAFTDIVDSTKRAAQLGDKQWRQLLEAHDSLAASEVESVGGRLVKFTGDGLMATFDGPARAVQCIRTLSERLGEFGLPIRAGVHTGEVEVIGDDIGGIAVHIAARISARAAAGEILTSSTVRDLVAGSGLEFDDRGEHELKGVPGTWRVLAVR